MTQKILECTTAEPYPERKRHYTSYWTTLVLGCLPHRREVGKTLVHLVHLVQSFQNQALRVDQVLGQVGHYLVQPATQHLMMSFNVILGHCRLAIRMLVSTSSVATNRDTRPEGADEV